MSKYLITHSAVVGRTKEEGAVIAPISLTFYSMVEASSVEEANEAVVAYRDPGFSTRVVNVHEVGEGLSSDELFELLNHKKIIIEEKI